MSHVSPQFVENSIDGAMLATLTDEDLQGLLGLSSADKESAARAGKSEPVKRHARTAES